MIYMCLADGFEEVEALTPLDLLRRAGLEVVTVGISGGTATGAHGITVSCDLTAEAANPAAPDILILPGGMPGTTKLDASPFVDEAIREVQKKGGRLAAICAAPLILGRRGLLEGKRATCYPGFEGELKGAIVAEGVGVVTDGNITTAKGMGVAFDFGIELIRLICGEEMAKTVAGATMHAFIDRIENATAGDKAKATKRKNAPAEEISVDVSDIFEKFRPKKADPKPAVKIEVLRPSYDDYTLPPLDLLTEGETEKTDDDALDEIRNRQEKLISTLESFNVNASVKGIERGPRVTRYELVPAKGTRATAIINLYDDICMAVAAKGVRMESIPERSSIGVEIPNRKPQTVRLRDLIESEEFLSKASKTAVCIGMDVEGNPVYGDIAKMPHALIAGATGMGKSVLVNSLLISMLYKARPDELKLILIDPKKVEFNVYNGIPHLLIPVVTDPKQAVGALAWAVEEMERRYEMIEKACARNIEAYNAKVKEDPALGKPMPKIVIAIDELNDLMMQVKDPIENLIMSIAQKARAAGIHLIIGTQRPSVNVITGVIKANIPTRIACKVSATVDSRTIMERSGAENLLNNGDMLFHPVGLPDPIRVQGAFVSDAELGAVIKFLKKQAAENPYDEQVIAEIGRLAEKYESKSALSLDPDEDEDDGGSFLNDKKFLDAVKVAIENQKIATSLLQRKLAIGYGKAAKYIDAMESLGIISEANGAKPREVLITADDWSDMLSRLDK